MRTRFLLYTLEIMAAALIVVHLGEAVAEPADCYIRVYTQDYPSGSDAYINGPNWQCSTPICQNPTADCSKMEVYSYQGKHAYECACELPGGSHAFPPCRLVFLTEGDSESHGTAICRPQSPCISCPEVSWTWSWVGEPPQWTAIAGPCGPCPV
jgi:hypothetical protein